MAQVVESLSGTSTFGGAVVGSTHSPSGAPGVIRQICFLGPGGVLLRNLIHISETTPHTKRAANP